MHRLINHENSFSNHFSLIILTSSCLYAQEKEPVAVAAIDSTPLTSKKKNIGSRYDSLSKAHSPRKAAIRSALLPGLGQIYNKNTGNCQSFTAH